MKGIILFILLWASPIALWLKYLLTIIWTLEVLCNMDMKQ